MTAHVTSSNRCPVCGRAPVAIIASGVKENLALAGKRYRYVRCTICGIISQDPLPSPDFLGHYYKLIDNQQLCWQQSAPGKTLLAKQKERLKWSRSPLVQWLQLIASAGERLYPYWHLLKPGLVVDLGAGSAGFCLEAKQKGWHVAGIEQSSVSVDQARQMGFELIQADLASAQARQLISSADNVVLNHVLEHVLSPADFIESLSNLMKPGARLVFLIPNPNSIWRFIFGLNWYGWDPPVHVHHYSAKALRNAVERFGFTVLELRSIRRNDSLATALDHVGIRVGRLRFLCRVLMIPIMPLLAWAGFGPELLCVANLSSISSARRVGSADN